MDVSAERKNVFARNEAGELRIYIKLEANAVRQVLNFGSEASVESSSSSSSSAEEMIAS